MNVIVKDPRGITTENGPVKAGETVDIRNAAALSSLLASGQVALPDDKPVASAPAPTKSGK